MGRGYHAAGQSGRAALTIFVIGLLESGVFSDWSIESSIDRLKRDAASIIMTNRNPAEKY
jgi:hypothetical protein